MDVNPIYIRELDIDSIPPRTNELDDIENGGSKLVIIGKPGSGKSRLIKTLLYEKSHIFAVGAAQSGTEDSNHFYEALMPPAVIGEELDLDKMEDWTTRQKFAREHIKTPWGVYILDDVTDEPKTLKTKTMLGYFKNSRHWCMLFILSLQYALDVLPAIRGSIDGTFIMREVNVNIRKKIYENYAGVIPSYKLFNQIMDFITDDYTALYINNRVQSNKFEDCVFYYKADKEVPKDFKVGCYEYSQYFSS